MVSYSLICVHINLHIDLVTELKDIPKYIKIRYI